VEILRVRGPISVNTVSDYVNIARPSYYLTTKSYCTDINRTLSVDLLKLSFTSDMVSHEAIMSYGNCRLPMEDVSTTETHCRHGI
jgi:hypothetical protein